MSLGCALRESLHALMEGVPHGLSVETVGSEMASVGGVLSVHDLHVWMLSGSRMALSAHVVVASMAHWERTRRELEVASTTRDAVLAREAAVRWSSADYAAWKIDRDAANGEVDRLMSLIADLEAPARQQEQAEREYAIRSFPSAPVSRCA